MSKNGQFRASLSSEALTLLCDKIDEWSEETGATLDEVIYGLMGIATEVCKEVERQNHFPAVERYVTVANFFADQLKKSTEDDFKGTVEPPRRLQ